MGESLCHAVKVAGSIRIKTIEEMKMKKLFLSCLSVALMGGIAMAGGHEKGTLAAVKSKGHIQCGVSQGLPGFSNPCLLYTSPSPRDGLLSRMPSSA